MDEMDDDQFVEEFYERGRECCQEVSEALIKTLNTLRPMLKKKYNIEDALVQVSVAKALLRNGVNAYTKFSPFDADELDSLYLHVQYMIVGAMATFGKSTEPPDAED